MEYKEEEKIFKALANRRRLSILDYLKKKGRADVTSISNHINLSFTATSKHLKILYAADILDKEQRSTLIYYRISDTISNKARHIISII